MLLKHLYELCICQLSYHFAKLILDNLEVFSAIDYLRGVYVARITYLSRLERNLQSLVDLIRRAKYHLQLKNLPPTFLDLIFCSQDSGNCLSEIVVDFAEIITSFRGERMGLRCCGICLGSDQLSLSLLHRSSALRPKASITLFVYLSY